MCAAVFAIVILSLALFVVSANRSVKKYKDLTRLWKNGEYKEVYDESGLRLEEKPLDFFLLSMRGYSAFQLAVAQINNQDMQMYGDESIAALRKALLQKSGERSGRVHYVLGKAYFLKGADYANQAIKYLEEAVSLSYRAEDIPEYLGLAYAELGDYRKSVEAFSEALSPADKDDTNEAPSDILLLAIARSYFEMGEADSSRAYLIQCIDISKDFTVQASALLMLGKALMKEGDIEGAEQQYLRVLREGGERADARYELGVLYAARGENTKARAEWRKVLRLDPAYTPAIARLTM
ncbi:MAG: tetratricopeptide repeat protein [Spirochaetaceae bacterium]|nr:tetratricopeptide repeat protein [Spirochaetaceae bacterium]